MIIDIILYNSLKRACLYSSEVPDSYYKRLIYRHVCDDYKELYFVQRILSSL